MTLDSPRTERAVEALNRRSAQADNARGVGLFTLLRELERKNPDLPRIGRNPRLRQAIVRLGQDPFLSFPDADVARLDPSLKAPVLRAQFLGFFGAFGALPLNWTEEVWRWFSAGDEAFVSFTDIFAARFQELFFRAWSDARALTQFDHPDDQFQTYLLSFLGSATPGFRNRSTLPDTAFARLAPLAAGRVKSPVKLRQMLELHFNGAARFEMEEMLPSWLEFEPDELSCLGQQSSTLGRNIRLGSRTQSLGEKLRIHVHVKDFDRYRSFLPGGAHHAPMRDIIFWYLGQSHAIDIMLWLPKPEVRPAVLGQSTHLGWMACIAPDLASPSPHSRPEIAATEYSLTPQGTAPRPNR